MQVAPQKELTRPWPTTRNQATTGKAQPPISPDKRLFICLTCDHEWLKLSPAGIREVVVKRLSVSPSLIGRIKAVNSGFAITPCSNEAREELIKAENGLFLSGAKLEPATNWIPIIIPTVPAAIQTLEGRVE